jgi:hypothetical protein
VSARRERKTVSGTATNEALAPNTERLKVGDETAKPTAAVKTERKAFGSYLPMELQRQFKAACVLQGVEMQDALEEAIRSWLAKNSPAS